jgi:hypothetical protein
MSLSNSHYIPVRFAECVATHIAMNIIDIPFLNPPLILGIHGPAGEGKTSQCLAILRTMNVTTELIYADEVESDQAGVPAANLKKKYIAASNRNNDYLNGKSDSGLSVIIINDVDQAIGRTDSLIQQTVNTQLVNKFLMDVADTVSTRDYPRRVPIIVTGNNMTALHSPLLRDGRMQKFEWSPNIDERAKVVRRIFPESVLTDEDIVTLVKENTHKPPDIGKSSRVDRSLPISSYAMIRYEMYRAEVSKMIQDVGIDNLVPFLRRGSYRDVLTHPDFSINSVRKFTAMLIEQGMLQNHLEGI